MNINDFANHIKESYDKPCPKCQGETTIGRNGPHIEWRCPVCGHIKFLPQAAENFIMPIGKYKGKLITEIKQIDREYCIWASENLDKNNMREKFKQILAQE